MLWGNDASPHTRVGFAAQIRVYNDEYQAMITDAADSPWKDVTIVGRILSRDEALAHTRIREVFQIIDHIVNDDAEIHAYFARARHLTK